MSNTPANQLLSNGLPFEFLVSRRMKELSLNPSGAYSFKWLNSGDIKEMSIDNCGTIEISDSFDLTLLVECKYNHDSSWIFFNEINEALLKPTPLAGSLPTDIVKCNIINEGYSLGSKQFPGFQYTSIGAITGNKDGHNLIKKAAQQLQRATTEKFLGRFEFYSESPKEDWGDSIEILTPIAITNSPIRIIKDDVTLEELKTKPVEEISTVVPFLAYHLPKDLHATSDSLKMMKFKIIDLDFLSSELGLDPKEIEQKILKSIIKYPSVFWIINFDEFQNGLEAIKTYMRKWREFQPGV